MRHAMTSQKETTMNTPSQADETRSAVPPTLERERRAAAELLRLIWGIHISRCVYAAAELGIADLLSDHVLSSDDLARATGAHEPSLYRVLRVLAALGVLQESESRSFSLTSIGDRLRSDAPVGMRSWATFLEALGGVRPFAHILETVKTGTPGLDIEFGTSVFGYLTEHPDDFATFNAAMSERTASFAFSVADSYDFSDTRRVVDLGGGNGTLLVEILRQNAHLTGVLLEIPAVAAHADAILDATDIANRCEVLAGDFFERVPAGADCYVLANVLHDWDDERSIEILRNCLRAMHGAGKVLIVERLIPENGDDPLPTLLSDINMLILTGGQERTNTEYHKLLEAAGLTLGTTQRVAFPYGVIEGLTT
jgi:SAM-dependent methyltransferase